MALPDKIFAHASPHSIGAPLVTERGRMATRSTVGAFRSHPLGMRTAAERLAEAGFEILQSTPFTINIAGAPDTYERWFRTKIVTREIPSAEGSHSFLDSPDTGRLGLVATRGTELEDVLEGLALEVPREFFQPSPDPAPAGYHHLRPPEDLANLTGASLAHHFGVDGAGVRVAMVDSGYFAHPYFTSRGYDIAPATPGPGAANPEHDENGHGTAELANIVALAPRARVLPVKMSFVNSIGAFNAAVALGPDIITCSWGSNTPFMLSAADQVLAASIAAAVARGIVVVFSAGNGHAGFPGQHPDVISVGGVHVDAEGWAKASDYASGFESRIYPGRVVPDVSGLVGMRPRAIYIMLPVEPGCRTDMDNAGGTFPDGDGTAPDDGWAALSGTSAAAPQIAGAAALLVQAYRGITSDGVRTLLAASARDVAGGACSPVLPIHGGLPAIPGPDAATGAGLVDAFGALLAPLGAAFAGPQDGLDARHLGAYLQGYAQALADA